MSSAIAVCVTKSVSTNMEVNSSSVGCAATREPILENIFVDIPAEDSMRRLLVDVSLSSTAMHVRSCPIWPQRMKLTHSYTIIVEEDLGLNNMGRSREYFP